MNRKTLIILISSIVGVLILAGIASLIIWKTLGSNTNDREKDASKAVTSEQSSQEEPQGNPEESNPTESQTNSGTTNSTTSSQTNTPSDGKTAFTVKSMSAKKGQVVKVPVTLTDNPGIMAFQLKFTYDINSLEYLRYEKTGLYQESSDNVEKGSINILVTSDQDVKQDGDVLYLYFKVKDSAAASTEIKASAENGGTANYNEQLISCKTVNGTITIN